MHLSQRALSLQESAIRKLDITVRQQTNVDFFRLNIGQPDIETPPEILEYYGNAIFYKGFTILWVPFGTFLGLPGPSHFELNEGGGVRRQPPPHPSARKIKKQDLLPGSALR